jgi:hypothetical protein
MHVCLDKNMITYITIYVYKYVNIRVNNTLTFEFAPLSKNVIITTIITIIITIITTMIITIPTILTTIITIIVIIIMFIIVIEAKITVRMKGLILRFVFQFLYLCIRYFKFNFFSVN